MSTMSEPQLPSKQFMDLWHAYTDKKMELENAQDRIEELEAELAELKAGIAEEKSQQRQKKKQEKIGDEKDDIS